LAKILSYKLLFEVSQAEKGFETALYYYQKHTLADKLYYDEIQAKHIVFQIAEHQAIEQQNEISLLNKKNDLLTAEQALTNANAENTRLIVIVLSLTLSVLLFWGIRLLKAHKRIKELSEYDALTDIFNRGHFSQVANNALRYCQSADQELSIIMFDLDYFKKINDDYGHACGDWALHKTVEVCKNIGRQNDIFARLGGEEFCLLLTSCNSQTAKLRAEACRKAILVYVG
jgi:GGDEF domain-containing protein